MTGSSEERTGLALCQLHDRTIQRQCLHVWTITSLPPASCTLHLLPAFVTVRVLLWVVLAVACPWYLTACSL